VSYPREREDGDRDVAQALGAAGADYDEGAESQVQGKAD